MCAPTADFYGAHIFITDLFVFVIICNAINYGKKNKKMIK